MQDVLQKPLSGIPNGSIVTTLDRLEVAGSIALEIWFDRTATERWRSSDGETHKSKFMDSESRWRKSNIIFAWQILFSSSTLRVSIRQTDSCEKRLAAILTLNLSFPIERPSRLEAFCPADVLDAKPLVQRLREYLRERIPEWILPTVWIPVTGYLPRTSPRMLHWGWGKLAKMLALPSMTLEGCFRVLGHMRSVFIHIKFPWKGLLS
ncbi:hypothetical protein BDW74DRAFT_176204 [Aspergillus multicolor]|uniref:uncharacterized protein n=1 Tax=Aspergillus multicolor TaxID=41759 RepID=UPI003CCCD52C